MSIDIISSFHTPMEPRKPGDEQRARIKAKLELWTFLDESIEEILNTYLDEKELAQEIINTAIWQLHPHYAGPELIREVQFVLKALRVPVPNPYLPLFTQSFQRIVLKKMAGQISHNQREKKK